MFLKQPNKSESQIRVIPNDHVKMAERESKYLDIRRRFRQKNNEDVNVAIQKGKNLIRSKIIMV